MTTYNKFKTTAFNGPVYSDTFDSINNNITISNASGTTTFLGKVNLNSVSNTDETVQNDLSTGSDCVIGGQLTVNSDFHSSSNVYAIIFMRITYIAKINGLGFYILIH